MATTNREDRVPLHMADGNVYSVPKNALMAILPTGQLVLVNHSTSPFTGEVMTASELQDWYYDSGLSLEYPQYLELAVATT